VTSEGQLALLSRLGFNRLSMGVQDFDPAVQEAVRRIQSVDDTRRMVDVARALGFRSVNFDLIYGLPRQTPASWQRTLARVTELRPDRVALFSFAYVPAVKPHQRRLQVADLPDAGGKLELFRIAHERLTGAGYRWIGMDHFALPDDELAQAQGERRLWRDFQGYTVERATDTVALGVSGISSVGGAYGQNVKSLARHAALVGEGQLPVERGCWLSDDDQRRRDIITQIMCNFWVDLGAAAADFGPELERLRALESDGLVSVRGGEVTVTPLGRVFVRNVAMVFDAYLGRQRERPTFSRTV
jgi:oxygen-independent coproporphyrinogen III oxidase